MSTSSKKILLSSQPPPLIQVLDALVLAKFCLFKPSSNSVEKGDSEDYELDYRPFGVSFAGMKRI